MEHNWSEDQNTHPVLLGHGLWWSTLTADYILPSLPTSFLTITRVTTIWQLVIDL